MKKLLIAATITLSAITSAFAGDANETNYRALKSFKNDFTDVKDVRWDTNAGFYTATFDDAGTNTQVYYDFNGNKVATCKTLSLTDLSAKARENINKKFNDYSVKEVISYQDDNHFYYFIAAENETSQVVLKVEDDRVYVYKKKSIK